MVGAPRDGVSAVGPASVFRSVDDGVTWSRVASLGPDAVQGDTAFFGESVAISGDTLVVGARLEGDPTFSGSAYVFRSNDDGATWSQIAKLTASDAAEYDTFPGRPVAISGDIIVVGSPGTDDAGSSSGSAYVFRSDDGGVSWPQVLKLSAKDAAERDEFGISVAISGETVVVGSYLDDDPLNSGSAYVLSLPMEILKVSENKLTASDAAQDDEFGRSVAISGDTLVVGSSKDDDAGTSSGSAYVFHRDGEGWSEIAKLMADDAAQGDQFGYSVAISASGDTVVVGAISTDDPSNSGSAYVFHSDNDWVTFSQVEKLRAADAGQSDRFGFDVAISGDTFGDTIVVGSPFVDDPTDSGSAYVFRSFGGGPWLQIARLSANDAGQSAIFGNSVAICGETMVIGSRTAGDPINSGSAHVFRSYDSGSGWVQFARLKADDAAEEDNFGSSVAISGDTVVVGARFDDDPSNSGSAYVFRSDNDWVTSSQVAKLTAADAGQDDLFGFSVAISGDTVVVGAPFDDDPFNSGSVYARRARVVGNRKVEGGQRRSLR